MKRLKLGVHAPEASAIAVAFLITALILFLLTLSVKEEKALKPPSPKRITSEITLSGGEMWVVHFGGYDTEAEARIAGARYVRRGAGGCVIEKDGVFYAAGNLYENKEEAKRAEEKLKEEGLSSGLMGVSAEDAVLKVTAEEEKIRFLKEGYDAYTAAEKSLMSLSNRLDAGKASLSEALLVISVIRFDMKVMEEAKEEMGDGAVPGKIRLLFSDALSGIQALLQETGGEMLLSARVKCTAICMRNRRFEFLNAL